MKLDTNREQSQESFFSLAKSNPRRGNWPREICDLQEKNLTYKFYASVRGKSLIRFVRRSNHIFHSIISRGAVVIEIRFGDCYGDRRQSYSELVTGRRERYTELDRSYRVPHVGVSIVAW